MKLLKLIIENYRGYQGRNEVYFDELTAFIGKNDVGKTTILDALGIFFENKLCKYDTTDKCVYAKEDDDVKIGCVFTDFPDKIVLDATSETTLSSEFLLNAEERLELYKVFKKGKGTGSIYAKCSHPSVKDAKGILQKKNDELKAIAERLQIQVEDKRSNVSLRKAIYAAKTDLKLTDQEVSLSKEDGKIIWEQIQIYLPHFALFRSDRPNTDEESEVQDPMKSAISNALADLTQNIEQIKDLVKEKAITVANNTIEHLAAIDPNLASKLQPEFKSEPKWDSIFKLSLIDENGIPINKRGSGVRRLILISFFKAEAERIKSENYGRGVIYAIEEPETSQHPTNQKALIDAFKELSESDHCQVVLTTHVPALAEQLPLENIRHIHRDGNGDLKINQKSQEVYSLIAKDLGVLPDSRARVIVCVEGPNDIEFLKRMSKILIRDGVKVPDLNHDPKIVMLPLGGDTLRDWVNKHYLQNIGKKEVHIYDRDMLEPPKYKEAHDKVNTRGDGSIAFLTKKREMENYIHPDAIFDIFNINMAINDDTDVPVTLSAQTRYNESNTKKKLNTLVIDKMSYQRLQQSDPNGDILSWFSEIAVRL